MKVTWHHDLGRRGLWSCPQRSWVMDTALLPVCSRLKLCPQLISEAPRATMVLCHGAAPGFSPGGPEQATVTSASLPPPLPQSLQWVLLCPFQVTSVDLGSSQGWRPAWGRQHLAHSRARKGRCKPGGSSCCSGGLLLNSGASPCRDSRGGREQQSAEITSSREGQHTPPH